MTTFNAGIWYGLVHMEIFENYGKSGKGRYGHSIRMCALSPQRAEVQEMADALNKDRGFLYAPTSANDAINNPSEYAGRGFFYTVKKYKLNRTTLEKHEKDGLIISSLNFRLQT